LKQRQVEPELSKSEGGLSPLKKILGEIRGWN